MTDTTTWPYDADRNDPLTALRIPVVSTFNPNWHYVIALMAVDTGRHSWGSAERPTDAEAKMLVSYLQQHRHYWFADQGYARKMDERPLDIDSGWNTTVFCKYGPDDWAYRRVSWQYGPLFVPTPPHLRGTEHAHRKNPGPLSLEQVMDLVHTIGDDGPMAPWARWKAARPDVFGGQP